MPDIATVFKQEAARIARRELRSETAALKKASVAHRSDIAALKRRVQELERALAQATKRVSRAEREAGAASGDEPRALRFRPQGFARLRQRLGLSARDLGRLLDVSGQSIYLWESGRARPGIRSLEAIAELRALGKREAAARLAALG